MTIHKLRIALVLSLASCSSPAPEESQGVGASKQAIIGGSPHRDDPAVVAVVTPNGYWCTGTVITPTRVLTAAHCVDPTLPKVGPGPLQILTGPFALEPTASLTVADTPAPRFHRAFDSQNPRAGHDIAIVTLDQPAPMAPLPYHRGSAGLGGVRIVGYGANRRGQRNNGSGVKRSAFTTIIDITPELLHVGNMRYQTCEGDSGGPTFQTLNGVEQIVGVHSFVGGTRYVTCLDGGWDTRIDANLDFIECVDPPQGIVAWWPGDGNAEDIVGNHTGTLEGGVSFLPVGPTGGKVGQAFRFDGSSGTLVSIPAAGFPVGSSARTVEFWTKLEPDSDNDALGFGYGAESVGQGFHVFPTLAKYDGQLAFSGHGNGFDLVTGTDLRDGRWHHVATSYDGSTVAIYVDGMPLASGSFTLATGTSGGACVGGRCTRDHAFMTGQVDEVTLYSRALTVGEIQGIVAAGSAGKCK